MPVRDVAVLRAACRYLAQTGTGLSRGYVEETVLGAPDVARALLRHFTARHDPDARDPAAERRAAAELDALLAATTSLDQDRILRGLRDVLAAVLRTNAFQRDAEGRPRPQLALKTGPARCGRTCSRPAPPPSWRRGWPRCAAPATSSSWWSSPTTPAGPWPRWSTRTCCWVSSWACRPCATGWSTSPRTPPGCWRPRAHCATSSTPAGSR
nr:NAD-glutamate dehydrogenase domain-containing protein [Geodermatophilus saharensis]